MSSIRIALCAAVAAGTLAPIAAAQIAPGYTLTAIARGDYQLGSPSINDAGSVALGFASTPPRVWNNGVFTSLGGPGSARGMFINNAGHVLGGDTASLNPIGWFNGPGGGAQAFAGAGNYAVGINDSDQVVYWNSTSGGYYYEPSTNISTYTGLRSVSAINNAGVIVGGTFSGQAATWQNGVTTLLPNAPGFSGAVATGINNVGTIVGYQAIGGTAETFPVRWNANGTVELLPFVGIYLERIIPSSINDAGLIVGYRQQTSTSTPIGVAWYGNSVVDLNTRLVNAPGWVINAATDVNASGQIVGTGIFNGLSYTVILNPTPTPGAAGLFGVAAAAAVRRRRR